MKITTRFSLIVLLILIIFINLFLSVFTVQEGHVAFIERLGRIKADYQTDTPHVFQPGLYFKYPFIDQRIDFDLRIQNIETEPFQVSLEGDQNILIDYYVRWRIDNVNRYFEKTKGDLAQIEKQLIQTVKVLLTKKFSAYALKDIFSVGEETIALKVEQLAEEKLENFGIEVVDIGLKRFILPKEERDEILSSMRIEREKAAAFCRAEANIKAETIRSHTKAQTTVIVAAAKVGAEKIRAEGEKKAAQIYANAYGRDLEFYKFYRSLQAYREIFSDKETIFVLQPHSHFLKYFNRLN